MRVEFYRHGLGEAELEELRGALDSRFLAYGPRTLQFEEEFGRMLGVPHVVGLNSCTSSLFLCQKALGIGPGDEVITTPGTFVATASSVRYTGADVVFADVDRASGLLDPVAVEARITPRTRAILVVHLYGQMVDMERFRALADKYRLHLIEDAAHCAEGSFRGYRPGQLGDAAAFSFYATKNLACGEGGALATRDQGLADEVRLLAYHGVDSVGLERDHNKFRIWDVTRLGYKASMFDIQAALLLPQLRRLDQMIERRDEVYRRYVELIAAKCPEQARLPRQARGARKAHHLFPSWCPEGSRPELLRQLVASDVGVGIHYPPIHLTTHWAGAYGLKPGLAPIAEELGRNCVSLPFYPGLRADEQSYVVDTLARFFDELPQGALGSAEAPAAALEELCLSQAQGGVR